MGGGGVGRVLQVWGLGLADLSPHLESPKRADKSCVAGLPNIGALIFRRGFGGVMMVEL